MYISKYTIYFSLSNKVALYQKAKYLAKSLIKCCIMKTYIYRHITNFIENSTIKI